MTPFQEDYPKVGSSRELGQPFPVRFDHGRTISNRYANLWSSRAYADARIVVNHSTGNAEFNVHRFVLSALSYFRALFSDFWKRGTEGESNMVQHTFTEFTPKTIEILLEYLYLGKEPTINDGDALLELMRTADYYCSSILKKMAIYRYRFLLKNEGQAVLALKALQLAEQMLGCDALAADAIEYLRARFREMSQMEEFMELSGTEMHRKITDAIQAHEAADS